MISTVMKHSLVKVFLGDCQPDKDTKTFLVSYSVKNKEQYSTSQVFYCPVHNIKIEALRKICE